MRRNRRINELFGGIENLTLEGRSIKHPLLIQYYANLNVNKTREDIIQLIGVDIETNADTGEMKLLGLYEGDSDTYEGKYRYYTDEHFRNLASNIQYAMRSRKNLAYWNSLDAFQILRLFILQDYSDAKKFDALERYGKVSGEYDRKKEVWEVRPVIAIDMGHFIIGIKQVIRDSIQFFTLSKSSMKLKTCWGYNVASLFIKGLEKEADINHGGRFNWYSKVDEEAHIVNWDRFENDKHYRKEIVLKSNELDAKAALALGYEIQKDFKDAFRAYPVSLISQGSHARSAIVAQIHNDLVDKGYSKNVIKVKKLKMLKSIPITTHLDSWLENYPEPVVKNLNIMFTEAYSGGYIDAIRFGTAEKGWFADIASAYPAVIKELWDLTDSTLQYGTGEPPDIPFSYIFIRGIVDIPLGVDYHPITIKHFEYKDTNIRPTGIFKATYTKDERDFVISVGGKFTDEEWTAVITKGKPSVLSKVVIKLIALRNKLLGLGKLAEAGVKRIVNSIYGIEFEAVNIYEDIDNKPTRVGYRAGEFWQPLYATIITSRTRIILASACNEIVKNGGEPILLMTDSITWKGNKNDLPDLLEFPWGSSGVKLIKTLGYFEEPDQVRNIVCFGSGRYGFEIFKDGKWKRTNKRRGLNIIEVDDPDGFVVSSDFSWENVMKIAHHNKSTTIKVKVRSLITAPTVRVQHKKYTIYDLGRIVEQTRDVDLVGNTKRLYNPDIFDIDKLSKGLVKTDSIHLSYGMYVENGIVDGTLPLLREKTMQFTMTSRKVRRRVVDAKRQDKHYKVNKDDIRSLRKKKYDLARLGGHSSVEAIKMRSWSVDRIKEANIKLAERRKEDDKILNEE